MKQQVWQRCLEIAEEQMKSLESMMVELRKSAANEGKSTAGDKHETALAMVQIEQEQLQRQINIVQSQLNQLHAVRALDVSETVQAGSLLNTDQGLFYICTGIGKLNIEGKDLLCISPTAPLASSFLGKKKNDVIFFNRRAFRILDIS